MADDFARLIEPLARLFFGEPNSRLSTRGELRFGKHGSLSVDLEKGTWYDHEQQIGGGSIDLVKQQKGLAETRDAVAWLEEQGYLNGKHEPRANGGAGRLGTEIAHYDYVDEAGNLVLQVVRYEPKDFRQRRPDGKGGWQWSIAGARAVPYRLPELIEALSQDYLVYICEGEKDCDNLRRLGIHATTNAMGAGKWRSALNQYFIGADVVIIADNDPQQTDKAGKLQFHPDGRPRFAGQDHAHAVAAELTEVAARVRVLDLGKAWAQCPAKGDISDWLGAGGTAELLHEIVERLPTWSPPKPEDAPIKLPTEYVFPDPRTMPCRQWLRAGHYIRQSTTSTVAPGGFGKTTLTLYEALLMVADGLRVWYLSGEDPMTEIDRRIAAHCQHHGVEIAQMPGRLFVDDKSTFPLSIGKAPRGEVIFDDAALAQFEAAIRAAAIDVVMIDPFVSFHGVPENDNGAIDQIVKRLAAIAFRTNCCIEISHHVRKTFQGQSTLTVDDARGGTAIINAVRSARVLNRMNIAEAEGANVARDRRGFYFRVDKGKRNMAPPEKADWFQMMSVLLPNGDNVQALEPWEYPTAPSAADILTGDDTEWVRELVGKHAYRTDPQTDDWLGFQIAKRKGLDLRSVAHRKLINMWIGQWLANKVFKKMPLPVADQRNKLKPHYVGMAARPIQNQGSLPLDDGENDDENGD